MTTSAELRAELCDLYAERARYEKDILASIAHPNFLKQDMAALKSFAYNASENLRETTRRIGVWERNIAELEAATPVDQRIKDAELLVSAALGYSEGVRSRHADALAEVEQADADLERAVEAAKQVIEKIAEEQPELRGKIGETGCFQIARGMKYETVKVGGGTPTITIKFVKSAFNPERS